MHELVFHREELESDDSDGSIFFVEVVFKEHGGVQGQLVKKSIGMQIYYIKLSRFSTFLEGLLFLLVADDFPTGILWVKYFQ